MEETFWKDRRMMNLQRSNAARVLIPFVGLVFVAMMMMMMMMGKVNAQEDEKTFSYIDNFDVGCDLKGTYECKMYGMAYLNGSFIDLDVRPTMKIYGVQRLTFLMEMQYPNADPEKSKFCPTKTDDNDDDEDDLNVVSIAPVSEGDDEECDLSSRERVVETAGAAYRDDAMCAFQVPFTGAERAEASLNFTIHVAHCYEANDASISLLRIIGGDCSTILMNAGEPAVNFDVDGDAFLWPYSSTYECHKEE